MHSTKTRKKVCVKLPIKSLISHLKFTAEYGLEESSHPADCFNAFITEHMKKKISGINTNSDSTQTWKYNWTLQGKRNSVDCHRNLTDLALGK